MTEEEELVASKLEQHYGLDRHWSLGQIRAGNISREGRWVHYHNKTTTTNIYYMPWGDDRDHEEFRAAWASQAKMLAMYNLLGESVLPPPDIYLAQIDECGELFNYVQWKYNPKHHVIYQHRSKLLRIHGSTEMLPVTEKCATANEAISEILGIRS